MPDFIQKLGLNEYRYDRVFAFKHLPDALCEPFFKEAVKDAQGGKKVLWECAPESQTKWRDRFVEALCATWLTNAGVEVGPRDLSL